MKIGVISDTHGIVPAWEQATKLFEGADAILHAGDVLYHPPKLGCTPGYDIPSIANLMNASPVPIIIARGNCDSEVYEELLEMPVLAPYAFAEIEGLRFVIQHGHNITHDQMVSLAREYHADVFITGHTHLPIVERIGKAIHLNPGSASHPKWEHNGVLTPTVGLITHGHVRIVSLDSAEELISLPIK